MRELLAGIRPIPSDYSGPTIVAERRSVLVPAGNVKAPNDEKGEALHGGHPLFDKFNPANAAVFELIHDGDGMPKGILAVSSASTEITGGQA